MAYLDRAVIALSPDAVPRFDTFVAELLGPADLQPGQRLGRVEVVGWRHSGDHAHMRWRFDDEERDLVITLQPRNEADGAYLRTPRWNIGYLGAGFDAVTAALVAEVGKRVEAVAAHHNWSAADLHQRWFRRPDSNEYLEITPGKKLYLRVTDYCDENCVFCNATEGNANIVSSKAALRDLLGRLPTGGLSQIIFSGGEPTLVRALPDYVGLAADAGASEIILQTNGVALAAPGELERYLPWRDRIGVGFSLHAFDPVLSNLLTGALNVPALPLQERFRRGLDADSLKAGPNGDAPEQDAAMNEAAASDSGATDADTLDVEEAADPGAERWRAASSAVAKGSTGRYDAKIAAVDRAVALGFRVKITCVVTRLNVAQVPAFTRACWERWGPRLDRLQFSYAMPRGNAWLNPGWLLRFEDCVAPFAEAFEIGRSTGMLVETSQTSCVPPCLMPDYLDHYDLYGDYRGGQTTGVERVKPAETCTGCNFDRICAGVWRRYIDTFGTAELRTITDRPEPPVVMEDYLDQQVLDLGAE